MKIVVVFKSLFGQSCSRGFKEFGNLAKDSWNSLLGIIKVLGGERSVLFFSDGFLKFFASFLRSAN